MCLAARAGVGLDAADRLRPYTRAEMASLRDTLPVRGRVCPGCRQVLPRFADLAPDLELRIRKLSLEGRIIMAVREVIAATGCPLRWAQIWVEHPTGPDLHEKTGGGPDCFYCGKALRSMAARQCVACGMDWHDVRRVMRLGAPSVVEEGGPPDLLHHLPVVAWARIDAGVTPTGRTTHRTMSGPIPTAQGLIICKDVESGGWYVFHTDAGWTSRADTWHESLEDAQHQAAFEFDGIAAHWRYRPPPAHA